MDGWVMGKVFCLRAQGFGTFQALGLNHLKYGHGFNDAGAEAIIV